jgi:hypothetical protein
MPPNTPSSSTLSSGGYPASYGSKVDASSALALVVALLFAPVSVESEALAAASPPASCAEAWPAAMMLRLKALKNVERLDTV